MSIVLNKKVFHGFLFLPTELQLLCLEYFNLHDVVNFDSAYSNREKLNKLFRFYSSYLTNNYTYTNVASLRWIIKKMYRLRKYSFILPIQIREKLPTFHYICNKPDLENIFCDVLVKGQQDINEIDFTGMSVLHHASKKGNLKIITLLINKNINVDLQDFDGCTALYYACKNRHNTIISYLQEIGHADAAIRAKNGLTPLDIINQNIIYDKRKPGFLVNCIIYITIILFFIWYFTWLLQLLFG
jgi:hypothetical protein